MNRISTMLLVTLLVAAPGAGADPCASTTDLCIIFERSGPAEYGWTISASTTDPYINTTVATNGVATYYLWLVCSELPGGLQDGMAAAEFGIASTGVVHLATTPQNGFLNAGSTADLLLAVGGCPQGPMVAAVFLVLSFPGSMCVAPSGQGVQGTVDCSLNPQLWPMDWIGLEVMGPVAVETNSWGSVKQRYR